MPITDSEKNQRITSRLVQREVIQCLSPLVSHFAQNPDALTGSDYSYDDDILPLLECREDASDWTMEECRDFIREHGGSEPRTAYDPWAMTREELVEALESVSIACRDDESDDVLRAAVIANIDDETLDGLTDWREAAQEAANDNPREVFEHWSVSSFLAGRLKEQGESVGELFGMHIWGRTTTGQAISMDSVIFQIAGNMEILDGQKYAWAE